MIHHFFRDILRKLMLLAILFIQSLLLWSQHERPGIVAERIMAMQAAGTEFQQVEPLQFFEGSSGDRSLWRDQLAVADHFAFDQAGIDQLLADRPAFIALPLSSPEQEMRILLERVEITSDDFSVLTQDGLVEVDPGLHYRGMIDGDEWSLAAISVFHDEVMGLITDRRGQRVLGRLGGTYDRRHVLYHEGDLIAPPPFTCSASDLEGQEYAPEDLQQQSGDRTVKCVRFYWEAAYAVVQNKGSLQNATNWLTGLFNQSAAVYFDDGISVVLSQLFVWTSTSPYNQSTNLEKLQYFGSFRTSFNGDLGHLVDLAGGGGVAWRDVLCNSTYYRKAYSGLSSNFVNVPLYSWNVMVVTHEQGHNLGSRHTHACAWNGNNTAIDGCGPTWNSSYSEGDCPIGPIPQGGGTIMSYCHGNSVGINMSLGFGPQPKNLIINRINNASCLSNCTPAVCHSCPAYEQALTATNTWQTATGSHGTSGCWTYRLTVSSGSNYTFKTGCGHGAAASYDTMIELLNANCVSVTQDDNGCGDPVGSSQVNWTANFSGYLYVRVKGATAQVLGTHTLAYRLNTSCVSCPAHDFAISPSTDWQMNSAVHGANGCRIYQVPVLAGAAYTFKTGCGDGATASYNTFMELYNASCSLLVSDNDGCESLRSKIEWTAPTSGTVYLRVRGSGTANGSFTMSYRYTMPDVYVAARVFLEGAYESSTGLMRDDLRTLALIPQAHPYGGVPFNHGGPETVAHGVLATTGNDAIVDWVLMELRDAVTPTTVVSSRAGLLQRDGDIVETDGTSAVRFANVAPGQYRVAVRHRNHAGVISSSNYSLGSSGVTVNFTLAGTGMTQGAAGRKVITGVFSTLALWGGDANCNTVINYYGPASDRQTILSLLGSETPFSQLIGVYHDADLNMDGTVSYYGANPDRQFLLNNVGSNTPFEMLLLPLD